MIILFIIGLLLGAVAVVFALQNMEVITVSFLGGEITGSLSVILLLALTAGALIAVLMTIPGSISNHLKYKRLTKENKKLEDELRKQKEIAIFAKNTPPTEAEIRSIENGAIRS